MKILIESFLKEYNINVEPIELINCLTYKLDVKDILKVLSFVKNSADLRFTILTDLFSVDFPNKPKRFEINYSLLSLKLNKRLFFKVELAEKEQAVSIADIFKAACWYEREVYDMFGISFTGNSDMRRILTDYNFEGYPLRKDFPLTGYVQVRYDNTAQKVIYEPVKLEQEYRSFDFESPWSVPNYTLPGDEKAKKL